VAPPADRRDWSRREFLRASGALIVTFGAGAVGGDVLSAQGQFDTRASQVDPGQLDSWIAVNADGRVTAFTGKCELGQGMLTAQTQLVAEELGVPVDRVHLTMCDTEVCPDQGTTSGSQSTPTNFNERNLALAAATAREALVRLGSARLGVPATDLVADNGFVASRADRTKRVAFGDLVAGRKFSLPLDGRAKRRTPDTWTVLGKPVRRLDMPDLVTGRAEYVDNIRVPGMLHGVVVRPPTVGATLMQVDDRSVSGLPGVVKVVRRNNFVGVVAGKPFEAVQAARALKLTWTPGPALPRTRASTTTCASSRRATRWWSIPAMSTRCWGKRPTSSGRRTSIRIRCTARWAALARSPMSKRIKSPCGRRHSPRIRRAAASQCC